MSKRLFADFAKNFADRRGFRFPVYRKSSGLNKMNESTKMSKVATRDIVAFIMPKAGSCVSPLPVVILSSSTDGGENNSAYSSETSLGFR
jgi:hypothetical protein